MKNTIRKIFKRQGGFKAAVQRIGFKLHRIKPNSSDLERVSQIWGQWAAEKNGDAPPVAWTDSNLVQRYYIHPIISGTPDNNWLSWIKKQYFSASVKKALSLGCGDGCLERHAMAVNIAQYFDAYDISAGAVEIAKQKAVEFKIDKQVSYHLADLNTIKLPEEKYNVVFAAMSLHHIENLEHLVNQIRYALKPDGLFVLNEFVGPNRFQWTKEQVNIANDLIKIIPEKYRHCKIRHETKNRVSQPTVQDMIEGDPSEAVRSEEIIDVVASMFDIIHRKDYGGTILNILLEGIVCNFVESDENAMALLNAIFYIEKCLIAEQVLPSDFTLLVCQKISNRNPFI